MLLRNVEVSIDIDTSKLDDKLSQIIDIFVEEQKSGNTSEGVDYAIKELITLYAETAEYIDASCI